MAKGYSAEEYRRMATHISKQLGVDDEGKLSDAVLQALSALDKESVGTHPIDNDRRFPNVNQAANCWTAVNEYQYCVKAKGDHYNPKCMQRRRDFLTICPNEWLEAYEEQIEEGTFMGIGDTLGPSDEDEEEEEEEEAEEGGEKEEEKEDDDE